MIFKNIVKKVVKGINKCKPYLDSVVDPALVIGAANAGMLYGLFKISESDLSDPAKVLAIGAGTIADLYFNKKVALPLAKKVREIDLRKARTGLEAKLGSWIKTGVLAAIIATTTPYVAKNVKHIIYETLRPSEELVYKGIDVSNVRLAERETIIGRIQRTERWKYLTDKYEEKYNLPPGTLYAMIMEESYGDPTCINERDGGAGLIHMQPAKAQEMLLKVFKDCNDIASSEHASDLLELIKRVKYNLDSLIKYDDRFNNELLISKIAKEIANYYDNFRNWDAAIAAINTGPNRVYNKDDQFTEKAAKYIVKIEKWRNAREDYIKEAKKDFNGRNLKEGLTFDKYVEWFKNSFDKDKNNGNRKK